MFYPNVIHSITKTELFGLLCDEIRFNPKVLSLTSYISI